MMSRPECERCCLGLPEEDSKWLAGPEHMKK
jgi:hypothetical protein